MRSFIAIEVPDEVKTAVAALQDELKLAAADVAWINTENIHLTLKFLGEIEKKIADEIGNICAQIVGEFQPFSLGIKGTGVFPNARHPRVLWIGLDGEVETLERLQERLDERLTSIGFDPEEKDFSPHLTVGRVRSGKNARELLAKANDYPLPPMSFVVEEILLMKSDLHPAGAQYSELARAKMNAR
jgi:2'-5' RNA ligase